METISNVIKQGENIRIIGRKECFIDGVNKIINVNENEFCCELDDIKLIIKGSNIHINKLDLDKKYVQLNGNLCELKYAKNIKNSIRKIFGK